MSQPNPASADVMGKLREIVERWTPVYGQAPIIGELCALLPALGRRERESFNKGIERAATRLDALGSMAVNTPEQNEILQYAAKNILELRAALNPTEKG